MQPSPALPELVGRWVAAGIITEEQAQRIRADLATMPPQQSRGSSLVAEALGYLGGVVVLVGLSFVVGWFWEDLTSQARVGVAGAISPGTWLEVDVTSVIRRDARYTLRVTSPAAREAEYVSKEGDRDLRPRLIVTVG